MISLIMFLCVARGQAENKARLAAAASLSSRVVEKDYDEIVALLEAEVPCLFQYFAYTINVLIWLV